MDIRILGPLEVDHGGRRISLGPKQQTLLAILLIEGGTPVPVDRIVERLYPKSPPTSAAKSVQVHVSRLRSTLGDRSRLQTAGGGYRFVAEPGELDLDRFEALAGQGRRALEDGDAATAASRLAEALLLWRGPALAEFAYADFAQTEIARLEERRLETLEDRIDADLALGRHASIVGELRALAAAHPLRERLTGQLMLALYRSGRQAEALDTFAKARSSLVDTLGIDPGRALRELERRILQQDPSLDLQASESRPTLAHEVDASSVPTATKTAAHESRKTVTALFARLVTASTAEVGLDPEAARRVTVPALAAVSDAVLRHGGIIQTITADGAIAVFGIPSAHEDDAVRAVRASEEIRKRLRELASDLGAEGASRLEFRIGVSTGIVVTGDGDGQLLTAGEPFRMSSRLGQTAQPGETLLDEATTKLTRDAVLGEEVVAGDVAAFRLVGLAESSSVGSRFSSPMVGRERERRRMRDAYAQAVNDRSCQLFTILGAAGVGKSRLVREFLAALGEDALIARGRCLPYGDGITFWPLLEVVTDLAELEDAGSVEEGCARIAALVPDEEEAAEIARRIAEMVGLADESGNAEDGFSAVQRLVESLGRARPLVLVLDDIHWGEATFLDLVDHLADWCRASAIVLLCMARPELLDARPHWGGGKLNATSVLLEPLSENECAQLVRNLLGETERSDDLPALISNAAEGNPLFVEELLSMLIDEGLLVRRGARWIATADLTSLPVPPTINALLVARLDRLGADERDVIERAAVEGKVFHLGSVAALGDAGGPASVTDALGGLLRKELVRPDRSRFPGEEAYRFRHLLIRDAAYDSIPKRRRAALHERHAVWLERMMAEGAVEYDEIVGYHLEQAFRYRAELEPVDADGRELGRRAARRLGRAGRRAVSRSDLPAGTKLIARAVALLAPEDPLRVELVPTVRGIQGLSDVGWADRVLTEAVEAAATTGDRQLAAHALVQRALLRLFTDMEVTSQQLFDVSSRAISVFDELNDDLGLARAWRLAAQAHYLDGRPRRCADASERALVHARRAGDPFEEREIVEWLLVVLMLGPTPAAEAAARCELLLDETGSDGALRAYVQATLAELVAQQGRQAAARELIEQSLDALERLGELGWIVSFCSGLIHLWEGDRVAADAQLVPVYDALQAMGDRSYFTSIAPLRAAVAYAAGRYEEAERFTRECEDACRANDVYSAIVSRSIRAKVLARRGAFDDAERLACEAVSRAERSDFLVGHAEALADLAEVRELKGDVEGAATVLEQALSLYEQKGNTLAAAECRARLASR